PVAVLLSEQGPKCTWHRAKPNLPGDQPIEVLVEGAARVGLLGRVAGQAHVQPKTIEGAGETAIESLPLGPGDLNLGGVCLAQEQKVERKHLGKLAEHRVIGLLELSVVLRRQCPNPPQILTNRQLAALEGGETLTRSLGCLRILQGRL